MRFHLCRSLLIMLLLAGCRSPRTQSLANAPAPGMVVTRNVAYAAQDGVAPNLLSLDIYAPGDAPTQTALAFLQDALR